MGKMEEFKEAVKKLKELPVPSEYKTGVDRAIERIEAVIVCLERRGLVKHG